MRLRRGAEWRDSRPRLVVKRAFPFFNRRWEVTLQAGEALYDALVRHDPDYWAIGAVLTALLAVLSGVVLHARDITRRKDLAEAAKTSSAETHRQLVSYLCHEIRNPLDVMGGLLEELPSTLVDQETLHDLVQTTKQIDVLVNDILSIRRLAEGRLRLQPRLTSCKSLIASIASRHMRKFPPSVEPAIQVRVDPLLPEKVMLDPLRLRQIVENGLTNALRHNESGSVVVRLSYVAPSATTMDLASKAPSPATTNEHRHGASDFRLLVDSVAPPENRSNQEAAVGAVIPAEERHEDDALPDSSAAGFLFVEVLNAGPGPEKTLEELLQPSSLRGKAIGTLVETLGKSYRPLPEALRPVVEEAVAKPDEPLIWGSSGDMTGATATSSTDDVISRPEYASHGLGLPITASLVQRMEGFMGLEGVSTERRTRFWVLLPIWTPSHSYSPAAQPVAGLSPEDLSIDLEAVSWHRGGESAQLEDTVVSTGAPGGRVEEPVPASFLDYDMAARSPSAPSLQDEAMEESSACPRRTSRRQRKRNRNGAVGASTTKPQEPRQIVVVVDDDRTNLRMVAKRVERLGFEAIRLSDGTYLAEQLDELARRDTKPLAILLDIVMHQSNGAAVCRDLRAAGCSVPIAAMTGNVMEDDVASYRSEGFNAVLAKPFDKTDIQRFLSLCEEHRDDAVTWWIA